jgi:hypothetical protein
LVRAKTKKALRVHVGLAIAEAICVSAFAFELSRALSGNSLSWAYVFEWPLFAAYAIYMWRRLLADEEPRPDKTPPSASETEALEAYNAYLEGVHRAPPASTDRDPAKEPGGGP